MRFFQPSLVVALAVSASAATEEPSETSSAPSCTATSSTSNGAFFDLRLDIAVPPSEHKSYSSNPTKDYHARGYDYGKNFTLNICDPVIEPVSGVVGVEPTSWANISAYYTADGEIYSIGTESQGLQSRGRKLILQYTGGSPCEEPSPSSSSSSIDLRDEVSSRTYVYDDEDRALMSLSKPKTNMVRRKSSLISFICDREHTQNGAFFSFVGTDPDECSYFFEVRSIHACAQAEPHQPGSVGPGSVFGLILVITVLVYLLGGIFYNRTVAHARGWRQLPNYSMWAGIWSFICVRDSQLKTSLP
jgi:cation-dependent mannose-6-phosphate receptor